MVDLAGSALLEEEPPDAALALLPVLALPVALEVDGDDDDGFFLQRLTGVDDSRFLLATAPCP